MEKARWSEIVRYNSTIVDYFKKAQAQIVGGHEVHVEEELVTQTCDYSQADYLKDSLAQIACGCEAHAQKGVTPTCDSKRVDY